MAFTDALRTLGADGLVALLELRPDLAAPPPASVRALAARASGRASLERALATLATPELAAAEAVLALHGTSAHPGGPTPDAVVTALDPTDRVGVLRSLDVALAHALVWDDAGRLAPAPGLADVLGPYPAGLGPTLAATLGRRTPGALERLERAVRAPGATGAPAPGTPATTPSDGGDRLVEEAAVARAERLAARLAEPATVDALLATAPAGARTVLDALAWGPPVGRSPAGDGGPAGASVAWLLAHGLLAVGDPQHVVLPREVALALRGGRLHRTAAAPPAPTPAPADPRTVAGESARSAEDAVRLVAATVALWGDEAPPVLRAGGLGTRELRRLATRLDVPEGDAALIAEVAGTAGLVVDDGDDPPAFTPTTAADDWLARELPERWALLARAWLAGERAAWIVGTRDDRGALRTALDPAGRRPWAPRLRRAVLGVLAEHDGRLSADDVHAVLTWRTPRAAPTPHAVAAVLAEAERLGVTGAGALSPAGRALVDAEHDEPGADAEVAAALAAQLPPEVDEVLLQGDLTGVVPGRPSAALAALLEGAAQVESRGAGLTVRFTDASVRRALDAGLGSEDLLATLSRHARSGVPQPLEYLVLDAARRHGRLRAGVASSYLRGDEALLTAVAEDKTLRGLGLLRLAPTVLAAQVTPGVLVAALRERGHAAVAEDAQGRLVVAAAAPRRVRTPRRASPAAGTDPLAARHRRLARVVDDLLAADRREARAADGARHDAGPEPADTATPAGFARAAADAGAGSHLGPEGTPDPVLALALLRDAAAQGQEVWLHVVGPRGTTERRRVRPVRVDAGRVRAVDAERESELTVAVHRIAHVEPLEGA